MHQHIPFLRVTSIMTPCLYDVADSDFDPYDGDKYDQQLFEEK